jgi:hypothetical protein
MLDGSAVAGGVAMQATSDPPQARVAIHAKAGSPEDILARVPDRVGMSGQWTTLGRSSLR